MIPDLDAHIIGSLESIPSLESSLNRGDVIEIQGPAASGKTQLLYHLAANCILPTEVFISSVDIRAECTVHLGGWKKSVVVFDCEGHWDVRRLHNILTTRLNLAFSKSLLPPLPHNPNTTVSSIAFKSLSRLHLFRPTSSFQLAATLLNLPKYHAEQMPNEEIRMLFVDSISSFYWADRWQAEPSGPKKPPRSNPLGHVLRCLQTFRLSHGPVTFLTNWGLNLLPSAASSASPAPFFRQHLASPFPAPLDEPPRRLSPGETHLLPLTCHITLPYAFVSPLQLDVNQLDELADHGGGGLEGALRDERRKEVVGRGEIGAYVRIPRAGRGHDMPPRSVVGRFKLRVLERDVVAAPT
jgi:DNA-repair protein XRCC2